MMHLRSLVSFLLQEGLVTGWRQAYIPPVPCRPASSHITPVCARKTVLYTACRGSRDGIPAVSCLLGLGRVECVVAPLWFSSPFWVGCASPASRRVSGSVNVFVATRPPVVRAMQLASSLDASHELCYYITTLHPP